ncbi:hypothetical protein DENSPDRAFT_659229 [Dentipellis sp. KUC8613]|nr:hypothetical protein DENSPDRAFT_659229 [Dentipellis sp. KUC8613]
MLVLARTTARRMDTIFGYAHPTSQRCRCVLVYVYDTDQLLLRVSLASSASQHGRPRATFEPFPSRTPVKFANRTRLCAQDRHAPANPAAHPPPRKLSIRKLTPIVFGHTQRLPVNASRCQPQLLRSIAPSADARRVGALARPIRNASAPCPRRRNHSGVAITRHVHILASNRPCFRLATQSVERARMRSRRHARARPRESCGDPV